MTSERFKRLTILGLLMMYMGFSLTAQTKLSKKITDPGTDKLRYGFYFAAGSTSMAGRHSNDLNLLEFTETTSYRAAMSATGKMAPFGRFGLFLTPESGPFRMIEMGMGYNQYRGMEEFTAQRNPGSDISFPERLNRISEFKHHVYEVHVNTLFILPLSRENYFIHGPGFSYEMSLIHKETTTGHRILPNDFDPNPDRTFALINYKVGFGMKLARGKFLLIEARAPLATIFNQKDFDGYRSVFDSEFKPLMVGVIKYQFMKNRPDRVCSSVKGSRSNGRLPSKKLGVERYPW